MIRLVAFDMDGTVADTLPLCVSSFQTAVFAAAGVRPTVQEVSDHFGKNETGMLKCLAGAHWQKALEQYYIAYADQHDAYAPFEGIVPLIESLRARGVMTAMVTGKDATSCAISLEKFGMAHLFDDVRTGSEHGDDKYEHLVELIAKYGLEPQECLYIGDAVSDAAASQRAGAACLSAGWARSAKREALEAVNPGRVFACVGDAAAYIEEILEK